MHHQIVSLPIPLPTLHHILPATNVILHPFVHNHSLYLTTRRQEDASSAETGQNLTCRTYVSLPVIRMEPPATSSNKNPMAQGPVGQESATVSHGMVHPVLHSPHAARKNIPVLSAAPQVTTCNYATPLPDLLIVNTPFIPDEWENLLNKLTLSITSLMFHIAYVLALTWEFILPLNKLILHLITIQCSPIQNTRGLDPCLRHWKY